MHFFKIFAGSNLTVRGGFIVTVNKRKSSGDTPREISAIKADYLLISSQFTDFANSIGCSEQSQADMRAARLAKFNPTFVSFSSAGDIEQFNPSNPPGKPLQPGKTKPGQVMTIKDLQERDASKWAATDARHLHERLQENAHMEVLSRYETQIHQIMVELGLRDPEWSGKAHDKTVIKEIDTTPRDRVNRLRKLLAEIHAKLGDHHRS
jgi:hypothetical protein